MKSKPDNPLNGTNTGQTPIFHGANTQKGTSTKPAFNVYATTQCSETRLQALNLHARLLVNKIRIAPGADGRLLVTPADRLTAELRADIVALKSELLAVAIEQEEDRNFDAMIVEQSRTGRFSRVGPMLPQRVLGT